jgi:hypothetical protein
MAKQQQAGQSAQGNGEHLTAMIADSDFGGAYEGQLTRAGLS